jgi:hypothetical protein
MEQILDARALQRLQRHRRTLIFGLSIAAALLAAIAGAELAVSESGTFTWPAMLALFDTAVLGLLFLAMTVEQYRVGFPGGDLTDHIPLFRSLDAALGLSGVYLTPVELLMAGTLLVLYFRAGVRRARLPHSYLGRAMAVLMVVVLFGALHGVGAGGDSKMVLWEIRPYVYLAVMYLLGAQLPRSVETITTMLWVFAVAVALKSIQGMILTVGALRIVPRPDFLLTHEDSLFFVLFMVLVAELWLFKQKGALRAFSTAFLPVVLLVNLANNRRASWLMLMGALCVLLLLVWQRFPSRRPLIARLVAVVAVVLAVYLPIYWNRGGLLAQPARAIQSAVAPASVRDTASDQYRVFEDANLVLGIRRSPIVGVGYGIPIDYVYAMVDLTRIDPFIKFIPHNDILYVWMRLGAAGALVFWTTIGYACVSACRLLRASDSRLALFGAFVLCALLAYLILGYVDMGLFWFRVAMFIGCLLGVMEVGRRIAAEEPSPDS